MKRGDVDTMWAREGGEFGEREELDSGLGEGGRGGRFDGVCSRWSEVKMSRGCRTVRVSLKTRSRKLRASSRDALGNHS